MPNTLAYAMLLIWPLFSFFMFRRLPPLQAVIWTILGGYLILPPIAFFNPPVLPDLDKFTIPNICAFVGLASFHKQPWAWPRSNIARLAVIIFILTPIATAVTNLDYVPFYTGGLNAMSLLDIPSGILTNVTILLPMFVGYQVLRDEQSIRELLRALVLAGLVYSIPMLIEIRLSPQINVWVYGFFQHTFDQMMRYGGFRPIVFLPHGIWVAFFAFMAAISAASLFKIEQNSRKKYFLIATYLILMVFLCKSASAIVYLVAFLPLFLICSSNTIFRFGAAIAVISLLYPLLRGSGVIPVDRISDFVASIDAERAGSLIYRLVSEDMFLARAAERPWFGWGGWGRNLVHDPVTGQLLTAIDGRWIIMIGVNGWLGYLGEFGLLTLPLLLLAIRRGQHGHDSKYAAALALILTANVIDLIPNATLIPFTWLVAGSLLGYAESTIKVAALPSKAHESSKPPPPWGRQRTPGPLS